jgi:gliding motility-associated-like protein
MKKSHILLMLSVLLVLLVNAQSNKRTNFWYFNDSNGLNFNSGAPVENFSGMAHSHHGGTSTMCDTNGNLLFYSTGKRVWNKNHLLMEGGFGGNDFYPGTQGALCMPKPGSDSIFYIFTSRYIDTENPQFYFTLNINDNNGNGKVIDIDTLLSGWDASQQLTAVYHPNKQDYWVLTRKYREHKYAAYFVNETGVNSEPVISTAPVRNESNMLNRGYMKVSYNKKYLITCFYGYSWQDSRVEICKFDNETGNIDFLYSFRLIDILLGGVHYFTNNCEFSPCSKYMYLAGYQSQESISHIYQFNMEYIEDSVLFKQSAIKVGEGQGMNIQLASDGKIYCFAKEGLNASDSNNYVGVIHNPEKFGTDCNYQPDVFKLNFGSVRYPFVNFSPDFLFRFDFEGTCESDTFTFDPWFFPEPDLIEWDFGDPVSGFNNTSTIPHATHKFTDGGTFEVSVHVEYPPSPAYPFGRIEETSREVEVVYAPEPNLGPDTTICSGSEILLDADCGPHGYSWSTGEWGVSQITVSDSGWYWVRAVNSEGCFDTDSIHIAFHPAAIADTNNLLISPTTCGGSVGVIRGLDISGNQPLQYQWIDDIGDSITNTIDIYHLSVGNYTLQVTDGNGCVTEFGPYLITDAGEVLIEDVVFTDEHCGQQNGSIIVTAISGLGDMLKYSITNGEPYYYNEGIFINLPSGTYAVRVKDSTNCEDVFAYNPIIIENTEGPQVTNVQITPATVGQNNGSLNIIALGSGDTIYYSNDDSLSFQINDGFFTNLFAGSYTCVVVDEFGCDTTFVVEVSEEVTLHLRAVAGADEVCPGNSAFVPLTVSNFNDVASFSTTLIYNNELLICTGFANAHPQLEDSLEALLFPAEGKVILNWASMPVTLPANTDFVELKFQSIDPGTSFVDWNGATDTSLFLNSTGLTIPVEYNPGNVTIYKELGFFFWGENGVCLGETLNISPAVFSSNGDVTYLWTFPDGSTNTNQNLEINEIQPNQSGEYKITVTDTANCFANDSVVVTVFPTPVPDFAVQDTIFTDDPFDLDAGSGYLNYWWNTGDTTQFIWADTEGWYSAQVLSVEGCIGLDSSFVVFSSPPELIKIFFPNAFTPNGDGLNDEFKVVTNSIDIEHFSLSIFNRWGALVYQTNDISQGWDGTFNGEYCQAGSYVYKIAYSNYVSSNTSSEIKMGTVMLVR